MSGPNDARAAKVSSYSSGRVNWAIGILLLIYTLNYLDRQIINILAEPIKNELGLSDVQIGIVAGLAFAVFYTTLAIPLARYADKPSTNRVSFISFCLIVWSGMTAACALVANFWQLMLARVGVGVGEAGCQPAAHSLISDLVPASKRSTALGIYSLGIPLGKMAGMVMGGWVAYHYGWRVALVVAGVPGVILALVSWATVRDPRSARARASTPNSSTLREVMGVLKRSPIFWSATVACSCTSLVSGGAAAFLGSFFIRIHGMTVAEVGLWLGLALGLGGAVGAWLGGWSCDRAVKRLPKAHMIFPAIAALTGGLALVMATAAAAPVISLLCVALSAGCTSFWYGPVFSTIQGAVPISMRATAAAVHLFVVNSLGFGIGPVAVGLFSDAYSSGALSGMPLGQSEGLRWALATVTIMSLVSAALFMRASKQVVQARNQALA